MTFALAVCFVSSLKVYFVLKYHKCSQRMNIAREIKVIIIPTWVPSSMVIL